MPDPTVETLTAPADPHDPSQPLAMDPAPVAPSLTSDNVEATAATERLVDEIASLVQPEQAPAPSEDVDDGIEYLASGRVRFYIDGRAFTLRRPTFGELRQFRERMAQITEDSPDRADATGWLEAQTEGTFALISWIVRTLGDKRLPEDEQGVADLPIWLASVTLPSLLLAHWQRVPLARGGQQR